MTAVAGVAAAADGVAPLSEQILLALRHPEAADGSGAVVSHLFALSPDGRLLGYAQLQLPGGKGADEAVAEGAAVAELVVDPAHRGHGVGAALAGALLADRGDRPLDVWAHGSLPAAGRIAQRLGGTVSRELWQLRRPLADPLAGPLPALSVPDGVRLRTFEPGRDEAAWLELNNVAFAAHPDQGGYTLGELQLREAEPWFDPAGFFLAERDGRLVGFHWTKVDTSATGEPLGEVYVVGVHPDEAGHGLGSALTLAGLHHLQRAGLRTVLLYVDADNTPAVTVYTRLGFTRFSADVTYHHA